jgi:phenylalanyl-tRNA synthetase beta chain
MRVPMSWLRQHVQLGDVPVRDVADRLTLAGLKVERVDALGGDLENVVIARVLEVEELTGFKKPIRWVTLTDGSEQRQVICGAANFVAGDVVAYARPPAMLPGGFRIERRPAYGRESDGMICSSRELGLGDDHTGILVLDESLPLGADVVEVLGLRDEVLDIAVNPDRGYALSIRGVAREAGIAFRAEFTDPADVEADAGGSTGYPVRIDDPTGCDRYVARIITGIDPKAANPSWLQRRLTLAGMRPISLAVDVTNHVMLELGQPLHAFDRATLRGDIVVRRASAGERIRTLDDVERALDPADVVITDDSGPVAIGGVMGGASTEISGATTDVVLEAAHFDPVAVAYTSRRHRLPSEASRRFERGVDDALAPAAAEVAVRMLVELGAAKAGAGLTDVDRRQAREVISLDPSLPGRLAGVPYGQDVVRGRLTDVGCSVAGDSPLAVTPPSWRPDLRRPVDLVEEVVRLEGYDALPSTVPSAPAGAGLTRAQRQRRSVGRSLAAAGCAEVVTYPFVSAEGGGSRWMAESDERVPSIRLANPVSDEEPYLRSMLLPGLLLTLARNVGRGQSDIGLFEIGSVFRRRPDAAAMPSLPVSVKPTEAQMAQLEAALPLQPLHLAVAVTGEREHRGWWGDVRVAGWADAIELARVAARAVDVPIEVQPANLAPWHPGRCAALVVGGRVVGHAGELHPRVVDDLGLPARSCAAELDLGAVLDASPELVPAPAVSAYPPASLDVAVVVDANIAAADVTTALAEGAGPLLESLRLFDVYAGPPLGAGQKSLAFALRLRAADRTLTAEDAVTVRDAAVAEASRRCGAVLRGT